MVPCSRHLLAVTGSMVPFSRHLLAVTGSMVPFSRHLLAVTGSTVPFSRHSFAAAINPVGDSQTSASCATGHVVKRSHSLRRIQATHSFLQYVFLGVFTKLRKVTIRFMYVGPSVSVSVRRHGTTHLPLDGRL